MNATTQTTQATTPTPIATPAPRPVIAGVDTHQLTHHVAVINHDHAHLGHAEFPATQAGYDDLITFAASFGTLTAIGVESTGSYGAGLTRVLLTTEHPDRPGLHGWEVYEVNRPEKTTRVTQGKTDSIDAYSAAEQVLTGQATGRPKIKTGIIEAIRAVKIARDSAVKDRTRAYSQIRDLATTAPTPIHDTLIAMTARQRVATAATYRPDQARISEPAQATKHALRALARRVQALDAEIADADTILDTLTQQAVPTLRAMTQVGPQIAAQLAITAGENITRMRSEATFAKLTGTAPLPASSGKTTRHRLNRGGDRHANSALYLIAVGRMRNHPDTRTYVDRRRAQGHSNPEIIRCLKRHLARSTYKALKTDLMTT